MDQTFHVVGRKRACASLEIYWRPRGGRDPS